MANKQNELNHLYRSDLERAVLATILAYPASAGIAMQQLQEFWQDVWTDTTRRRIAKVIYELHLAGDQPDLVTVEHGLENSENPEDVSALRQLTGESESADVLDQRSRELRNVTAARQLYYNLSTAAQDLSAGVPEDTSRYASEISNTLSGTALGSMQPERAADVAKSVVGGYYDRKAGKTTPGIEVMTDIVIPYGTISVLGGRPSHGKSAKSCWWALHAAENGNPVIIFTHEPTSDQILMRMACQKARVAFQHAQNGTFNEKTERRYTQALQSIGKLPLIIYDMPGASPMQCRAALQYTIQHVFAGRRPLVLVDYLQLERIPDFPPAGGRNAEVTEMSAIWLDTFRQTGSAGVLLSQVNREAVTRAPRLSDLRESGAIEQDASCVYFVYRPGRDQEDKPANVSVLMRAKNRDGDLLTRRYHFTGYCMSYAPWSDSVHEGKDEEKMKSEEKREVHFQSSNAPADQPELNTKKHKQEKQP